MLVALGFLAASLLGLLLASALWSRAVRLTTRRIKQSMPVSEPEIKADRDRLRAEYAIKVHKLETELDHTKLERARQLIEINRRDASISSLETDMGRLKADLDENQNARRVLEQTVTDRLPKVEARLAEAKRLLFNRDREIAELIHGAKRHKQALEEASSINVQQNAQIERLSTQLSTRGGRLRQAGGELRFAGEAEMRSEIEALRLKTREQATLIDRLQRRLGNGYLLPASPAAASAPPEEVNSRDMDRLRKDLSEAEAALSSARGSASEAEAARAAYDREIRALKARTDDQAGEIARLKAALSAFEQHDDKASGSLRGSKIALKAKLGAAQAQAEQQATTIVRLRGELAAAHERMARQAAHFMDEMRRIGTGVLPASGQVRRQARGGERRGLAERVAQVRPAVAAEKAPALAPPRAPDAERTEAPPVNGRSNNGAGGPAAPGKAAEKPAADTVAAEMPKAAQIPVERRRPRLLDRITGLSKE